MIDSNLRDQLEKFELWYQKNVEQLFEHHGCVFPPSRILYEEAQHYMHHRTPLHWELFYERYITDYIYRTVYELYRNPLMLPNLKEDVDIELEVIPAYKVQAGISRNSHDDSGKVFLSHGLYHAIQDCILRGVSSELFMNVHKVDDPEGKVRWLGGKCMQIPAFSGPVQRYYDYTSTSCPDDFTLQMFEIDPELMTLQPTFVGRYARKMPEDLDRILAADHMISLGLSWCYLHEKGHYNLGHLDYINSKNMADKVLSLYESDPKHFSLSKDENKIMELQADNYAVSRLLAMHFWDNKAYAKQMVPEFASSAPEPWARIYTLIMTSIGSVMSLLDVVRSIDGCSDYYPTPRQRFCNAVRISVQCALSHLENCPLKEISPERMGDLFDKYYPIFLGELSSILYSMQTLLDLLTREQKLSSFDDEPIIECEAYDASITAYIYLLSLRIPSSVDEARLFFRKNLEQFLLDRSKFYNLDVSAFEATVSSAIETCIEVQHLASLSYKEPFADIAKFSKIPV